MAYAQYSSTTEAAKNLFAGDFPIVTRKVTIPAGAALSQGAVLGKITASGKYVLSVAAAGDGSEAPKAVLAEDVAASGSDREAIVYLTGQYIPGALTFGAGHTAASTRDALRLFSIFV